MTQRRLAFDIEANGLLDHTSIDYLSLPFKLKDTFRVWCIVFQDIDTGEVISLRPENLDEVRSVVRSATMLIAHNGIGYDLLVLKLYFGIDYEINEYDYRKCRVGGKRMAVVDTMILSQYLQPDRLNGHSLKSWGVRVGDHKGSYGESEEAWDSFSEDMLQYCQQDVAVTVKAYRQLMQEWGDWNHVAGFSMEQAMNEVVTRQEHIGFYFNVDKANDVVADLNSKLDEIESDVEPQLPKIPLSKTNQSAYCLPAKQIKQDGSLTTHMKNWVEKHNAKLDRDEYGDWVLEAYGKTITLPDDSREPLVTHAPMKLSNQNEMKQYLIQMGWNPVVWEQRDITLKSGTKQKVGFEKYKEAVLRYCEDTAKSHFKESRLEFAEVRNLQELYDKLIHSDITRPVRVRTSPKYTIDQDKTICPNLLRLGKKVAWIEQVVLWLTYRHRRNMLMSPNGTGLLTHPRLEVDGRVPTGAVVTGTNTYRFKHRVCVNIPRRSSVYGAEIRELFGCGEGFYQIGCDAASLEGRVQGHYCYTYTDGVSLGQTLIAEEPNDIHTVRANSLGINRDYAKAIGYACMPVDNTEVLTKFGWKKQSELSVGDLVMSYNAEKHISEWKPITHLHYYEDAHVVKLEHSHGFSVESTGNHRWFTSRRTGKKVKRFVNEVCTTDSLTTEHSIITSAPIDKIRCHISPDEAELIGWVLSDGHYCWSEDTRRTSSSYGAKRGISLGITQNRSKFFNHIVSLIKKLGYNYSTYEYDTGKSSTITLHSEDARAFMDKVLPERTAKHETDWVSFVLSLDKECLERFAYAFYLAEGVAAGKDDFYQKKTKILSQNEGPLLDALQITGQLLGWRTIVGKSYKAGTTSCKDIKWTAKDKVTMQRVKRYNSRTTDVFCLTVADNSSFVIRQGSTVTITGNCLYGAQWPKLKSMLGCTDREAQALHKEFWESTPALLELKAKVENYWQKNGKRFLKGIDGRKINTRSKHSLLNALFQSAGIVLMKWAAIILDRELEERGMLFRPFDSDTWFGKTAMMQHYHDEYQNKVCPSLVTEDADGNLTSVVGDLMEEAITKAGEQLKMRVSFAGKAMVGYNWKECH